MPEALRFLLICLKNKPPPPPPHAQKKTRLFFLIGQYRDAYLSFFGGGGVRSEARGRLKGLRVLQVFSTTRV